MPDPAAAAATQMRNIEQATGMTVADFAREVAERGIDGHGKILAFLKAEHGLSHGNANAMAHAVRTLAGGGPASSDVLLDAQYAGSKAALRPICERLTEAARNLGPDVDVVVQKTGVALRRRKQFGVVQAPSASRVALGLNLAEAPDDTRVVPTPGAMCRYRVDVPDLAAVDEAVLGWLAAAYEQAG